MTDHWTRAAIDGVLRSTTTFHADERGALGEVWRDSWTKDLGITFVQANLSISRAGVLRGLHFHRRQHDLWVLLEGKAQVALVDLRSADSGEVPSTSFDFDIGNAVLIPPGVAHGFLAVEDVKLLYIVSAEYDGTDEHGFAWDDPAAGIEWGNPNPQVSQRDREAPSLAEFLGKATGPSETRG